VLGRWRTVVIDDHFVAEHLLDAVMPADRAGTARESGVRQQNSDACEIAVVDELGVGCG
jgi:hypothetical protein